MIKLQKVSIKQGDFSIDDASLHVPAGCYAGLMGKSGCGKTSLLEAIAGLRPICSGTVTLNDHDVTHLKPASRHLGYVPQDRALFPNMRVGRQLAFSLEVQSMPQEGIDQRIRELSGLLSLENLLNRYPDGLSGGEAQRVALGRALANRPKILCLDEPLSALDEGLHEELCELLQSIHKELNMTILHVTHSRPEAERLAQKIWLFKDHQVQPAD